MAIKVLGVSGSMREGSTSRRALSIVLEAARAADGEAETRLLDLRELDLPMYRPQSTMQNESVAEAGKAVEWADVFVFATPDYHGSMSGAMKNFLDYHWTEFAGKVFGYLCASHEKGLTAMDQMRTVVRQCYGWSLPYGVAVHGDEDFDANANLKNEAAGRHLRMLGRDIRVYGAVLRQQFARDIASNATDTFAARYRK
ncbi:MAG: NADPH-dependent FMN reductase [Pyrinomonadaceae bacterium]